MTQGKKVRLVTHSMTSNYYTIPLLKLETVAPGYVETSRADIYKSVKEDNQ